MRTETFATPRQLVLDVRLPRGDIKIETGDVQETTVTLSGSSDRAERQIERTTIRLDDRGDHDVLLVDADTEDFGFSSGRFKLSISLDRRDAVDLRVTAPHGTNVRALTGSADIRAAGRFGDVETKTGSGDVHVADVERNATIKVASGDVRIDRVGGTLKVQTAAGDVSTGRVEGDAEVKTAAGDVALDEVGGSVAINSASGDLRVGALTKGSAELKSVSGDMLVGIRRGSRVWMDVKTITGDARSELEPADGDESDPGPLVELRATAMSGDIKIVRAE
jgi:Putative adhesin